MSERPPITAPELIAFLDETNRGYAKALVIAIIIETKRDPNYRSKWDKWLDEGGTLLLRDELASRFQHAEFVKILGAKEGFRYPFNEFWTALDTASLNIRNAKLEKRENPSESDLSSN